MKSIKYKIHFGEKAFSVNEWLYNYFNEVKEKPQLYNHLFDIIVGVKKQLLTAILILLAGYCNAQTKINSQTYYTSQSIDSIFKAERLVTFKKDSTLASQTAIQNAAFVSQITTLTNRVTTLEGKLPVITTRQDQQQVVINQTVARVTAHDTAIAKIRPTWTNPFDFLLIQGAAMDSLYLKNPIISK